MVAGANDVIDLFLNDVCFFAIESDRVTALKKLAITFNHCVGETGELVIESMVPRVVFNDVLWGRGGKRTSHACFPVRGSNIAVAACAD
jgi:hypothetical protein